MTSQVSVLFTGQDELSSVVNNVVQALLAADPATAALQVGMVALAGVMGAVSVAGQALSNTFQDSISEASQLENANARLVAVLNSTADASGLTANSADALAMQFRDLYGGSQQAVIGVEEVGIRSEEVSSNQMPAFIKAVADLGAEMGNTTAASTLLARAQDDPVGALTRVERATGTYDIALKNNIATMVKHGDTAGAVAALMQFVADKTGGAAAAAADTLSGKYDILTGHFQDFLSILGGPVIAAIENLLDVANPTLDAVYQKFEDTFLPLITNAAAWGEAIVEVLAEGMQSAFGFVVQVINDLGSIIEDLMAPGSPPKYMPNLDQWGRDAMNVYMAGWTTFDKSVFDEIRTAIKDGLPTDEIQQYADVMHNLADANQVTADAQANLNDVTAAYDAQLSPLNAALAQIVQQQNLAADAAKIAKLQGAVDSGTLDSATQQADLLEIQRLKLTDQISTITLEKNTAVDAAKSKVTAAQSVVASLTLQSNSLKDTMALQEETFNTATNLHIPKLVGALNGLSQAFAGAGGGAGDMKAKIDTAMDNLKNDIQTKADGIKKNITDAFDNLGKDVAEQFSPGGIFAPIGTALATVKAWWDTHHTDVTTAIYTFWQDTSLFITGHVAFIRDVVIKPALDQIKAFWALHHVDVETNITTSWTTFHDTINSKLADISNNVLQPGLDGIKAYWQQHNTDVSTIITFFWNNLVASFTVYLGIVGDILGFALKAMFGNWSDAFNAMKKVFELFWPVVVSEWNSFWAIIGDLLAIGADAIRGDWAKLWEDIVTLAVDAANMVINTINGLVTGMLGGIVAGVNKMIDVLDKVPGVNIGHVGGVFAPAIPQIPMPNFGGWTGVTAHANGLDMKIPAGFANDNFPLGALGTAKSGERVQITPAGQSGAQTIINVTGNYAYQDERTLAQDLKLLMSMNSAIASS